MFLTVCTPTFNRSYTLERVYNSLINQTEKSFEWVVIDDGSTDDTKTMMEKWIEEGKIKIKYYYQENSGKHIALNKGMQVAKGELFTCLDSDDWFFNNTIALIMEKWEIINLKNTIAGIITLDSYKNGKIVGTSFPNQLDEINWVDLTFNHHIKGDKAYYFRTEVIKNYPFPSFKGNKHMPPSYQYYMISKKYNFSLLNIPTKGVEYLEDGISKNKYRKYIIAPDNFALYRLSIMNLIPTFKRKILNAIHFNSSIYLGNVFMTPKKHRDKILVNLTRPFGYILSIFIKNKVKKNNNLSYRKEE